ncbi:GNAT family N-acetyltransferase [Thermosediminibacter litoriperuensis]|uniref:Ribosomal protein S18 acetylase RimI-like enzyme n=1 Tax=Thermosediminibacter litoriperuensis TaxID=291989 RepID=A0A5S5AC50_9FIRM|nr:GNAT family N-acetyltransferase [Thermosediminibacter litoriperuensis]TYP46572.1 ribosomal protein S18 acetylase RimI-like enzyme [Thermosediminibacter litoriperuensis]
MAINPSLRIAKEDDFDFVFQLNKANFKDFVDEIRGWNDEIEREDLKQSFRPEKDYIITDNGKSIGYLSVDFNQKFIYVRHIEVLPSYKRRGIGTSIFNQLKEKGLPIVLEVTKTNTPAYKFYEKLGFEVLEEKNIKKKGVRGEIEIKKVKMKLSPSYRAGLDNKLAKTDIISLQT